MPKEVFATAYYYHSAALVARMARVLGLEEVHDRYAGLACEIRRAFGRAYLDEEGRLLGDTQAGYALAWRLGLFDEEQERRSFGHFLRCLEEFDGHLSTGFLATVPALMMLTRFGEIERAYALVEATSFPSWGYTIERGATTIWERWDGWTDEKGFQDPGMNSFCHYAIGAVGEWLYSVVLGIVPDIEHPGFEEYDIKPYPGGTLSAAGGSYDSVRGRIEVRWRRRKGRWTLEAVVPPSSTARVWVRTDDPARVEVESPAVDGPARAERMEEREGFVVFRAGPGEHRFGAPLRAGGA